MSSEVATTKQRIAKFYQEPENHWAREFFHWASGRKNDSSITTVDRLARMAQLNRREAVKLLRELDEMGCGTFVVGRHGQKSRMEWAYSIRSIGEVAIGDASTLDETSHEPTEDAAEKLDEGESYVEHRFSLSPGRIVTLRLPTDFSKEDANRLSKLIQALPTQD